MILQLSVAFVNNCGFHKLQNFENQWLFRQIFDNFRLNTNSRLFQFAMKDNLNSRWLTKNYLSYDNLIIRKCVVFLECWSQNCYNFETVPVTLLSELLNTKTNVLSDVELVYSKVFACSTEAQRSYLRCLQICFSDRKSWKHGKRDIPT